MHFLEKFFFPPLQECSLCQMPIEEEIDIGLCPSCQSTLRWLEGNATEQQLLGGQQSLFSYEDQGKELILNYKYRFQPSLAGLFASWWVEKKQHIFQGSENPLITYVPMTLRREKERGFHSSQHLAKALAQQTSIPIIHALVKTKQPPEQHHLTREQRWAALAGVYMASTKTDVKGRDILLIDDVYTTGATLYYCAQALLTAGANQIFALTVAKTPA